MNSVLQSETANARPEKRTGAIASIGSIIAAVLASSCCILPLVLVTLGVSGAWIGNLTMLSPYKPYFMALAVGFLGYGFWRVYGPSRRTCEEGAACATPVTDRVVKTALWIAAVLVLLAAGIDFWAPLFY